MKSKYDYEIIRDYLHGLVDRQKANEISDLIKNDETARSIAAGIVRLEKEFKGSETAETYLDDFGQKQMNIIHSKNNGTPVFKKVWLRIAASLLILVSIGAIIRLMVATPDLQTLINQELTEPYPLSTLVRGEVGSSIKEKAFQLYAQGDYVNASVYFEKASAEGMENATIIFYSALSYLYQGNHKKANELFESDAIADSRYLQQADWYRALAFLKSGDKNKAKEVLTGIVSDKQHFKYEAATEFLKLLE